MMAVGMASAHLSMKALKPAATDQLKITETFTITWTVVFAHGKGTDIAVSRDDGTTWTDIKNGFTEASGENTFKWTVTGPTSSKAKIRICEQGDSPKPCTDANKTTDSTSGTGGHYVLVSPAFVIAEAGSAVLGTAGQAPFSIGFNPESRNVDVSFSLSQAEAVSLEAFDMQGHLIANLAQGRYEAGAHRLSVFSNRLSGASQAMVFRLKLGAQVHTQAWAGAQ